MPIRKTLEPAHSVSTIEATASYLQGISTEELDTLRDPRSGRAFRFAGKFQTVSALKQLLVGPSKGYANNYERGAEFRRQEVQSLARAACINECGACVTSLTRPVPMADGPTISLTTLETSCATDQCPERGLRAAEGIYATADEDAQRVIDRINSTPLTPASVIREMR